MKSCFVIFKKIEMVEINKGIRIINFLIDLIIVSLISVILETIFKFGYFYLVYLIYYFTFEFFLGQTIGKMITRTKVVDNNQKKPSIKKLIIRTILRLNPFDSFSYLFGQSLGSHDLISKTKLSNK